MIKKIAALDINVGWCYYLTTEFRCIWM